MEDIYKIAFAEVDEILKLMPKKMLDKIPSKFRLVIENEKSKNYFSSIREPLENCVLKEETIIILSLIYREFLCEQEEKIALQYRDAQKVKDIEEEISKKYDPDNIFKNRSKSNKSNSTNELQKVKENQNTALVEYKEDKWYKKLFNIIKNLFKKKTI